jgi:hypothetical protein
VLSTVVCGVVCIVGDSTEWSMSEVDVVGGCDVVGDVVVVVSFSRRQPATR